MERDSVYKIKNKEQHIKWKQENKKCILFFGAKDCHACDDIYPLYRRISNRYQDKIKLAYIDVDECELDFTSVPYFVSIINKNQTDTMVGANNDDLKNFIKKCIQTNI